MISAEYCAKFREQIKPEICRKKRRGMLSKTAMLHHSNARSHEAAATVEAMQYLRFENHSHYLQDYSGAMHVRST